METWDPYQALYLHIPFCKQRCNYCDFETQAIDQDNEAIDTYVDNLIAQVRSYSNQDLLGNIKTVYLGGGTPSYLGNKRLSSLLYALSISLHLTPEVECTLEANPDSLSLPMVKDLFALGVTRISLGVQSFDNKLLRVLGRVHNADQARCAIQCAQERFENISIDLMCGLPDQTQESFQQDLEEAIALGVKHVSVYPLTIEEGTPFDILYRSGQLSYDEDLGAQLMDQASEFLTSQGLVHYEVASYAFPGFESQHNSAYWKGIPYLGLGKGAVSMRQNDLCRQRFSSEGIIEELDVFQMAAEDLMLGMRMSKGVSDEDIEIASLLLPELPSTLQRLLQQGYIVHEHSRYKPTHKGWLFGNQLYGELLDLAP